MRAVDVANVGDGRATVLRRSRHAPAGHNKFSLAVRIVLDPGEPHDFTKLGDLADHACGSNAPVRNDLIVIRDAGAAAKFDAHFERMWGNAQPMIEFEPAIKALEPK
jgi:hypothetical protein